MRRPALAALLLLLATGCAEVQKLAASAVQRPRLELRSVSLKDIDLSGATVQFEYRLDNPNGFGLDLARAAYALEVEGRRVVDGSLPGGLRIPASGSAPLEIPVHFKFADVPGLVSALASREAVAYRLSGTAGIQTPIGVVDLPLSGSGSVPVPRLPGFALDAVRVRSASLSDVALDVTLRVRNPNAFPLPGGSLSYALALGGGEVARGEGGTLSPVAAHGTAVVSLPVRVSLSGAGRAAQALLSGGTVDVGVHGTAMVGNVPVPLDLAGKVPALR